MNNSLLSKLPHRPPFLFVDSMVSITANAAEASWTVNGSEVIFQGHFPGDAIIPGVLLIEALAQTAGLVLIARDPDRSHAGVLAHCDIRFRLPVRPPATISLKAKEDGSLESVHRFTVSAHHGDLLVAEGSLVLSIRLQNVSERNSARPV